MKARRREEVNECLKHTIKNERKYAAVELPLIDSADTNSPFF